MKNALKLILTAALISTVPLKAMEPEPMEVEGELYSVPSLFNTAAMMVAKTMPDYEHLEWFDDLDQIDSGDHMQLQIRKAYFLKNKAFFRDEPVAITGIDFHDFGYNLSQQFAMQDMGTCVENIFAGNIDVEDLQNGLDFLCSYSSATIPLAIQAHHQLVACVKVLSLEEMQQYFNKLQGPSILKMALQLVCAQQYHVDLDPALDCAYFGRHIHFWVNAEAPCYRKTELFSQKNLEYVLPLLEPLIGAPVTKLNLHNNQLTVLPESIGLLVNLQKLSLYNNKLTVLPENFGLLVNLQKLLLDNNTLTGLPESIGRLVNLQKLWLHSNKLTGLPESIGQLVNLQTLWLSNNQFTDAIKQALRQQFGTQVYV